MRTFRIGGTASRVSEQSTLEARNGGTVKFHGLQVVEAKDGNLTTKPPSSAAVSVRTSFPFETVYDFATPAILR